MIASYPRRNPTGLSLLLLFLAFTGCGDGPSGPGEGEGLAAIQLSANVASTPISTLVITVSAADLPGPLVFNLEVVSGIATGTLRLPAGTERTFSVVALDATGEVTHEGSRTIDVRRGPNPPLSIPLVPRSGQVEVTVHMGDYSVIITPSSASVMAGATVQLEAAITEPNGDPVPATPSWASPAPHLAAVDAAGLVTTVAPGVVEIMATYEGIPGTSVITVIGGPVFPPPGDVVFSGTGNMARAGGRTWSYTTFDLTASTMLLWGSWAGSPPHVALDGKVDPAEVMAYDEAGSNLAGGVLAFTGETTIRHFVSGTLVTDVVPTRLVVTVRANGAPVALMATAGTGLPPELGAVAPIAEDYTAGYPLEVNLLMDGFHGGSWTPALDLFDALQTEPGATALTSFSGAFYFIP